MVRLPPRVVVSAPSSSAGKTTLTMGLLAALRADGERVAPFKVGPDYIDPSYHALAAGRPGRNLDPHLCGEDLVAPLLAHGARTSEPADLAVIEGVMGLFDGRLGTAPDAAAAFGSTAHVARLVSAPVLLVLDVSHSGRSAAAVALGMQLADPGLTVGGVLLNRVSSPAAGHDVERALARHGIPVLGAVPRAPGLAVPSRHLGLVPAGEQASAERAIEAAAALVREHVDLDAVRALAASAPERHVEPWEPTSQVQPVPGRPRIAVAAGRAFTFSYAETSELLEAAGCEVVAFDPLVDDALPPGTAGLYLGGGFPEMHASQLAGQDGLRADIAAAIAAGLPTYAECAGLLYLCEQLDGIPMIGAVPANAAMSSRLTLGYHEAVAATDTLVTRVGERVRAHEFHRTRLDRTPAPAAWDVRGRPDGVSLDPGATGSPTLLASYQHVHWAGYPRHAQRFAEAAAAFAASGRVWSPGAPAGDKGVDLNHHGDDDASPGLLDVAVNARREPPEWLQDALLATDWGRYPDVRAARSAIAARHGVPENMVLPTAGAAEAFTLVARALTPRHPLVVHPQFTEPERALQAAGHRVLRHLLRPDNGFRLDPDTVDVRADLVMIGNPTNPTGVLHPARRIEALRRPERLLVVDEAFMDAIPDEPHSLIGPAMDGLLVVRSLTKTWGLAGARAGYVVGDATLVAALAAAQPHWPVSAPALTAIVRCLEPKALAEAEAWAAALAERRAALVTMLAEHGLQAVVGAAPFVLCAGAPDLVASLRHARVAARDASTFPGLGPGWIRLAVPHADGLDGLRRALSSLAGEGLITASAALAEIKA